MLNRPFNWDRGGQVRVPSVLLWDTYLTPVPIKNLFFYECSHLMSIIVDGHGVVGVINHESRPRCRRLFDVFFLDIVDINLLLTARLGVVGCESCCLLEGVVRKLLVIRLHNDMRTWNVLCMEPPVIACCKLEGEFFVCLLYTSPSPRDCS